MWANLPGPKNWQVPTIRELMAIAANVPELFDTSNHYWAIDKPANDSSSAYVFEFLEMTSGWIDISERCRVRMISKVLLSELE